MNHQRWTYRLETTCCGKTSCGTCRGKLYTHGPYWYRYRRDGDRVRKEYVGKNPPWEARTSEARALRAHEILGVPQGVEFSDAKSAWRKLVLLHHPDRGGELVKMQRINLAWETLKRERGWR